MRTPRIVVGLAAGVLASTLLPLLATAPAGATLVTNEADLRVAFANDASVELANDISLTDCAGGAIERTSDDPVVLDGQGFTLTQTCVDSVVRLSGQAAIVAQNITITGGQAANNGGGIVANGSVTVLDSVIRGNQANLTGGGIGTLDGPIILERTLVDGNVSGTGGGGISGGPLTLEIRITDSTISNNLGGGVQTTTDQPEVAATVVNSTIFNNSAAALGAGIAVPGGSVTLVYSTVANNDAFQAFENVFAVGMVSFGSVVVGGSDTGTNNCGGGSGFTSQGYNFSDDNTCGFTDPTDRQGQAPGSALLGPLADNGGPTPTLLPGTGSPLIDAIPVDACQSGGASGITTDQRGIARPQAGGCDIGAVEVVPAIVLQPTFTG